MPNKIMICHIWWFWFVAFDLPYFPHGAFPKESYETGWNTSLCITPHPHALSLLGSLTHSRYSVHVFWMKVLSQNAMRLHYWTDSIGFVLHELLYEAIVHRKDWFSPLRVNVWNVWGYMAWLQCNESDCVYSCIPGLWEVLSIWPFSPEANT